MGKQQTVRGAVNKGIIIGFNIVTSTAASTAVITAAQIAAVGADTIRDIHFKCTLADGYIGLGEAAAVIASGAVDANVSPIFQDGYFNKTNLKYSTLNVIRAAGTDVRVKGFVVVS